MGLHWLGLVLVTVGALLGMLLLGFGKLQRPRLPPEEGNEYSPSTLCLENPEKRFYESELMVDDDVRRRDIIIVFICKHGATRNSVRFPGLLPPHNADKGIWTGTFCHVSVRNRAP